MKSGSSSSRVPAVARAQIAEAAQRGETGLEAGDNRHAFAGRRDDRLLDDRRRSRRRAAPDR